MARYRYVGDPNAEEEKAVCAKGYVEFTMPGGKTVKMPHGVAVEVPDELAAKLANNNHFVDADKEPQPKKGKAAKSK